MVAALITPKNWKLSPAASKRRDAERRLFPRRELSGIVQGFRIDHTLPAHRQPQVNLSLRDVSAGGLSALSALPLERGERLNVTFPANSGRMGWDAPGRVIPL